MCLIFVSSFTCGVIVILLMLLLFVFTNNNIPFWYTNYVHCRIYLQPLLIGSVYFAAASILEATDRPELLCRQSDMSN